MRKPFLITTQILYLTHQITLPQLDLFTRKPSDLGSLEHLKTWTCVCVCVLQTCCLAGIGKATALALVSCGAKVIAVTRTQADLDVLIKQVHTHTRASSSHPTVPWGLSCTSHTSDTPPTSTRHQWMWLVTSVVSEWSPCNTSTFQSVRKTPNWPRITSYCLES